MKLASDALAFEPVASLTARVRIGSLRPVTLIEEALGRIRRLDGRLHAFIVLTQDRALAEARAAESVLASGRDVGALLGIHYAAKDLFNVKGVATTAGTRLLADNVAAEDCPVVQKLAAAGMVLVGKTRTDQLAYGLVGINHDHGAPHNPWHSTPHAPGGSSSGSAVAVASGLVPVALATDTGGSVRVPAALCGIVGLKTTVGRISRAGVYPLSWSLDSVGPLTRSVEDAALVYQVLQGADARDEATIGIPSQDVLRGLKDGVKNLRIAFGDSLFFDGVEPEIEAAVREAGRVLQSMGAQVDSIAVPEAAELLADKKRPLWIAVEACVQNGALLDSHFDELDPVVAPRMIEGRTVSATDYVALLRRVAALRRRVVWTLRDVDALLVPTVPIAARPVAEIDASLETFVDYNTRYGRNCRLGNVLNLCAVSVPCGVTSAGLPIGLMIYAKPFGEDIALRVAYAYEQATAWHTRHPDLEWALTPSNRAEPA
jgi:aspartyl-tRNA(Asn)/glutamyl-tRNA(Gln) amidotransferase subunit A